MRARSHRPSHNFDAFKTFQYTRTCVREGKRNTLSGDRCGISICEHVHVRNLQIDAGNVPFQYTRTCVREVLVVFDFYKLPVISIHAHVRARSVPCAAADIAPFNTRAHVCAKSRVLNTYSAFLQCFNTRARACAKPCQCARFPRGYTFQYTRTCVREGDSGDHSHSM